MFLYALSLEPLLQILTRSLSGLPLNGSKLIARAYADDLNVVVTSDDEMSYLNTMLKSHETLTGAQVNFKKSKILPLGNWNGPAYTLNMPIVTSMKILGIHFSANWINMLEKNWTEKVNIVSYVLQEAKARQFNLLQRIWFTHTYGLSKLWYMAKILPTSTRITQQLEKLIGNFIWHDNLYRVARPQLRLPKKEGGLDLSNIDIKCKSLFAKSLNTAISQESDEFDNAYISYFWTNSQNRTKLNPEIRKTINLIEKIPIDKIEALNSNKELYKIWNDSSSHTPHVQQKYPNRPWTQIWSHLTMQHISTNWKMSAYCIINEIIPTQDKQQRHGIIQSNLCKYCQMLETLINKITKFRGTNSIWQWVAESGMVLMTRLDTMCNFSFPIVSTQIMVKTF